MQALLEDSEFQGQRRGHRENARVSTALRRRARQANGATATSAGGGEDEAHTRAQEGKHT